MKGRAGELASTVGNDASFFFLSAAVTREGSHTVRLVKKTARAILLRVQTSSRPWAFGVERQRSAVHPRSASQNETAVFVFALSSTVKTWETLRMYEASLNILFNVGERSKLSRVPRYGECQSSWRAIPQGHTHTHTHPAAAESFCSLWFQRRENRVRWCFYVTLPGARL